MSYRDDDHSQIPEGPPAMIGGMPPRDALVPGGFAGPPAVGMPVPAFQRTPDVLNGGMDKSWFFHSLRRRWILALGMGLVLSSVTAGVLWWLFPESSAAVALFRVASEEPTLVFTELGARTRQFEILQKTQLALLKSHFVLAAAVRDPSIANLNTLAGVDDPVQWLDERLAVQFPQESEILRISLSGDEPSMELVRIVDAVSQAYQQEVVFADRKKKLSTRDVLATSLAKLQGEVRGKMEDYYNLATELGSTDASGSGYEARILQSDLTNNSKRREKLVADLIQTKMRYAIVYQQLKDPQFLEQQIDAALGADPIIANMQQEVLYMDYQMRDLQSKFKRGNSPHIKRLQQQIAETQQQIAQRRAEMKRQMVNDQQSSPNLMLRQYTQEFQVTNQVLSQQIAGLNKAIEEQREQLMSMDKKSVELAVRDAELEQLRDVSNDMALKIESWDVEMNAPHRIEWVQRATPTEGINTFQRYAIAGLGGIGTFALTCFAVAYLEFRNRRLNGPGQVDEGLGIRVVGTLPSLSSRRLLDPNHPIVAQLTESIDGVRTLLMHDATTKQRKVVLVASAATMEGRTTVASQLAASLARAGRRTLLIDGDLRRPALHSLFDVPLEDGVCEVLRAESLPMDVIRPTHAEGLWLMTAGYCDVDAIQALATDQLQPIFEKLRDDYDFIIIDGAPVLGLSDSLLFGQYSDGAILSVLRDQTEVPKIYQAAELLRGVGIRLIGAVVNGVPTKSDRRVTQLRLTAPKSERQPVETT